jgi:hypothetical protein
MPTKPICPVCRAQDPPTRGELRAINGIKARLLLIICDACGAILGCVKTDDSAR